MLPEIKYKRTTCLMRIILGEDSQAFQAVCIKKKSFIAVDISSNLCGISGVKIWDP